MENINTDTFMCVSGTHHLAIELETNYTEFVEPQKYTN